jgi:hypothetical protein
MVQHSLQALQVAVEILLAAVFELERQLLRALRRVNRLAAKTTLEL